MGGGGSERGVSSRSDQVREGGGGGGGWEASKGREVDVGRRGDVWARSCNGGICGVGDRGWNHALT